MSDSITADAAPDEIFVRYDYHIMAKELIEIIIKDYALNEESRKGFFEELDKSYLKRSNDFLTFIYPQGKKSNIIPVPVSKEKLNEFNKELNDKLYQFQAKFNDKIDFELSELIPWVKLLKQESTKNFQTLIGKKYPKIKNIFRSVLASNEIPVIHLDEDIIAFPIEFMYLDYGEFGEKKYENHIDQVFRFIAFSFYIKRYEDRWVESKKHNTDSESLSIKYFCHDEFKCERSFFSLLSKEIIDLKGPWPSDVNVYSKYEFEQEFTKHIQENTKNFKSEDSSLDIIQHFTCHGEIDQKSQLDSKLTFGNNISVSLNALGGKEFVNVEATPIIVFHACQSGEKTLGFSFPDIFMNTEHFSARAYVGPQVEISGTFVQEFSKIFYKRLLEGFTIGEALLKAKRFFIEAFNNPLGLLYIFYGDPEIKVSDGVEKFPQILEFRDLSQECE